MSHKKSAQTFNEIFDIEKPRLFNLAYKMLGSVSDAEDVLQESWLKWSKVEHKDILSPPAYLSRIVSRLCIDSLRAREKISYKGPWLPEPLLTDENDPPADKIGLYKDLSIAFLFMLENLNPEERAVFILKEAFDFSHQEIAKTLEIEATNSRQLLSRAKKSLSKNSNNEIKPDPTSKQLMEKFIAALWNDNIVEAQNLVSKDVISYSDGGGVVTAALIPIEGRKKVLQIFFHLFNKNQDGASLRFYDINGEPGLALYLDGVLSSVTSVVITGDRIKEFYIQRNPNKLKHFKQMTAS